MLPDEQIRTGPVGGLASAEIATHEGTAPARTRESAFSRAAARKLENCRVGASGSALGDAIVKVTRSLPKACASTTSARVTG